MNNYGDLEKQVARQVYRLPPMPENIDRLLTAAVDGDVSGIGEQVREMAENDPGLCSELLHLAGSACYNGHKRIETIEEALDAIGPEPLVQLMGVTSARRTVEREFSALEHLDNYFAHSRDISLSSQLLAEMTDLSPHDRDMYAVGGLIHDIGRLIIMISSNRISEPLMGTSWDRMSTVTRDEKELLGMSHTEVGKEVCAEWNFSPVLQEGVLRHHTPLLDGDDFSYPGALIFIAHFVSVSDFTGETLSMMVPPPVLENLGLTVSGFEHAQKLYASRASQRWGREQA